MSPDNENVVTCHCAIYKWRGMQKVQAAFIIVLELVQFLSAISPLDGCEQSFRYLKQLDQAFYLFLTGSIFYVQFPVP